MFTNQDILKEYISTIIKLFEEEGNIEVSQLLQSAQVSANVADYDNWNGGITFFNISIVIAIKQYSIFEKKISEFEKKIYNKFNIVLKGNTHIEIAQIIISPIVKDYSVKSDNITKKEILTKIEKLKGLMITVATGGQQIQQVADDYIESYITLDDIFVKLGIENPNCFKNLWDWYKRWKTRDLPTYQSRRDFINGLYSEIIAKLSKLNNIINSGIDQPFELTGWQRVDRSITEIKKRINEATNEEQFQAIGLLARDTMISLAQEVYKPEIHISDDNVKISKTDAKRMLEVYINFELKGSSNKELRDYSKSALALANSLTHDRAATDRNASICIISVISLVNIIKVISKNSNIKF